MYLNYWSFHLFTVYIVYEFTTTWLFSANSHIILFKILVLGKCQWTWSIITRNFRVVLPQALCNLNLKNNYKRTCRYRCIHFNLKRCLGKIKVGTYVHITYYNAIMKYINHRPSNWKFIITNCSIYLNLCKSLIKIIF